MDTKKTKAMKYAELREVVVQAVEDEALQAELIDFIDAEVATLEKRKASAKARADKKKEESDALTEVIFNVMTEELQSVDQVVTAVAEAGFAEVTRAKVTARVKKLVDAGQVEKGVLKGVDGGRKVAYKLAGAVEEE